MDLKHLMLQLAAHAGVADPPVNEQGGCRLTFGDNHSLKVEASSDGLRAHFTAGLGALPEKERGAILEEVMEAHLHGIATLGCHFCYQRQTTELLLCRTMELKSLCFTGFTKVLEDFLSVYHAWHKRLATLQQNTPAAYASTFPHQNAPPNHPQAPITPSFSRAEPSQPETAAPTIPPGASIRWV